MTKQKRIPKYLAKERQELIIRTWDLRKGDLSMAELGKIFNCSVSFIFNSIKQTKKENSK